MNEEKKKKKNRKQKENLVQLGLMDERDNVVDFFYITYAQRTMLKRLRTWERGWIYFTEEKIICMTGFLNENIIIPYENIEEIEKYSYLLCPIGIDITHTDPETNETKWESFQIWKRKEWLAFLERKTGIKCSN